ncbi:hypothetical protein LEMLEM_LOCUS20655 [Lemmus lemmus]
MRKGGVPQLGQITAMPSHWKREEMVQSKRDKIIIQEKYLCHKLPMNGEGSPAAVCLFDAICRDVGLLGHPVRAPGPGLAPLQLGHRLRCSSNTRALQVASGEPPPPSSPNAGPGCQTPPTPQRLPHRLSPKPRLTPEPTNQGGRHIARPESGQPMAARVRSCGHAAAGGRRWRRRQRPVAAEAAAGALLGGAGQGRRLAVKKRSRGGRHGHQLGRREKRPKPKMPERRHGCASAIVGKWRRAPGAEPRTPPSFIPPAPSPIAPAGRPSRPAAFAQQFQALLPPLRLPSRHPDSPVGVPASPA